MNGFSRKNAEKHFSNMVWFLYHIGAMQISFDIQKGWFCSGRWWHPVMWLFVVLSFFVAGVEGIVNRFGDIFSIFCKPSKYTYNIAPKKEYKK